MTQATSRDSATLGARVVNRVTGVYGRLCGERRDLSGVAYFLVDTEAGPRRWAESLIVRLGSIEIGDNDV